MDWWNHDSRLRTCDGWCPDFNHLDLKIFPDRQIKYLKENIKWSVLEEWCSELRPGHHSCQLEDYWNRGSLSMVRRVRFDDGVQWVIKMPFEEEKAEEQEDKEDDDCLNVGFTEALQITSVDGIENGNQGQQEKSLFSRTFHEEMQNNEELVGHDDGSDRPQSSGVSSDVSTPLTHNTTVSTKDDFIRIQHGNGGAKSISRSIPAFYRNGDVIILSSTLATPWADDGLMERNDTIAPSTDSFTKCLEAYRAEYANTICAQYVTSPTCVFTTLTKNRKAGIPVPEMYALLVYKADQITVPCLIMSYKRGKTARDRLDQIEDPSARQQAFECMVGEVAKIRTQYLRIQSTTTGSFDIDPSGNLVIGPDYYAIQPLMSISDYIYLRGYHLRGPLGHALQALNHWQFPGIEQNDESFYWMHQDLHQDNVLVDDDCHITAVIDNSSVEFLPLAFVFSALPRFEMDFVLPDLMSKDPIERNYQQTCNENYRLYVECILAETESNNALGPGLRYVRTSGYLNVIKILAMDEGDADAIDPDRCSAWIAMLETAPDVQDSHSSTDESPLPFNPALSSQPSDKLNWQDLNIHELAKVNLKGLR